MIMFPAEPKRIFLSAVVLLTVFTASVMAHSGATGIVKTRMDGFSQSRDNLKAIKFAFKKGNADDIAKNAEAIRAWSAEMIDYFPEGSNQKPSEALDVIWQDFEGFTLAAKASEDAASRLKSLAEMTPDDKAALVTAIKDLAASCSSCHRQYRK